MNLQHSSRILITDDDEDIRDLVEVVLLKAGFSCKSSHSVESSISILNNEIFDLIISDVNLPGKSGIDFLKHINHEKLNTPVIMLSGLQDVSLAVQCFKQGAYDFITKPFQNKDFIKCVNLAIEKHTNIRINSKQNELSSLLIDFEQNVSLTNLDFNNQYELIQRLAITSEYRDEDTWEHIIRVGENCFTIAETMSLPSDFCEEILLASQLHDIGKIGIPDSILLKPGKLSEEAFEVMKTHTIIGGKILQDSNYPAMQMAHEIALMHHERLNGTGYPFGLQGEDIPLSARIVGIVDVYDALINKRPYKKAWEKEEAVDYICSERGKHFDPDIVDAFMESLGKLIDNKKSKNSVSH